MKMNSYSKNCNKCDIDFWKIGESKGVRCECYKEYLLFLLKRKWPETFKKKFNESRLDKGVLEKGIDFLRDKTKRVLFLVGQKGVGKTHFSYHLTQKCVEMGFKEVLKINYITAENLRRDLHNSEFGGYEIKGDLWKKIEMLKSSKVIVIDDFLTGTTQRNADFLFGFQNFFDDLHAKKIIFTTNLYLKNRHKKIKDESSLDYYICTLHKYYTLIDRLDDNEKTEYFLLRGNSKRQGG
jgi:DNA replication protein DnaC